MLRENKIDKKFTKSPDYQKSENLWMKRQNRITILNGLMINNINFTKI